jgi:hypothetical protein
MSLSFAVSQARRELEKARNDLAVAKESESPLLIDDAQKALAKAQEIYNGVTSSNPKKAKAAADKYLGGMYAKLGPTVAAMVQEVPALARLVREAITNEWDQTTFQAQLQASDWWQSKSAPWRDAFAKEFSSGSKEWDRLLGDGRKAVQAAATKMGVNLGEKQLDNLARQYYYRGWDADADGMTSWIAQRIGKGGGERPLGDATQLEAELRSYARDFGLQYDDMWFTRQARKVLDPKSGVDASAIIQQMAQASESRFPTFKGRLGYGSTSEAGAQVTTLRDAAGDYVGIMSSLLDVQGKDIDMSDDLLRKAFNFSGEDGGSEPRMMSLYDFEREVRKDARWGSTKNAEDEAMSKLTGVLSRMGFRG